MAGDFDYLVVVIIGDQRLVRFQQFERFNRFDRVRVDNEIPDKTLPFFIWKMLDVLINGHKLGNAGDVETAPRIV